jgi:hypothetical protein
VSWKRQGQEKLHFINPVPINEITERWIGKFEQPRLRALSEHKTDSDMIRLQRSPSASSVRLMGQPERIVVTLIPQLLALCNQTKRQ